MTIGLIVICLLAGSVLGGLGVILWYGYSLYKAINNSNF